MNHDQGFTLIEVLFVITVLSVLIVISIPLQMNTLDKQTEDHFFNNLKIDLMYTQNLAYTQRKRHKIVFTQDQYEINTWLSFIKRDIPEDWEIKKRNMKNISFNRNGNISKGGTMVIKTSSNTYNIVCPLGKGRCYIDKQ